MIAVAVFCVLIVVGGWVFLPRKTTPDLELSIERRVRRAADDARTAAQAARNAKFERRLIECVSIADPEARTQALACLNEDVNGRDLF